MATRRVSVECYAGSTYPTEPTAFTFRGIRRNVTRVERQWRTPDALWFRVRTEQGEIFLLAYHEDEYAWIVLPLKSLEDQR